VPLLIISYAVLVHLAIAWHLPALEAFAVFLLALIVLWSGLWRASVFAFIALILSAAGCYALWLYAATDLMLYLPPVLMPALMLSVFGRSLRPGSEALITGVARDIRRGHMPDDLAAYTRRITWLWCGIFVAMILVHGGLALFAPREWWSWVANFGSYLALGVVFVIEHLWHRWRYSQYWHPNFVEFITGLFRVDYRKVLA
jgi:uncharacterized membrane protein